MVVKEEDIVDPQFILVKLRLVVFLPHWMEQVLPMVVAEADGRK